MEKRASVEILGKSKTLNIGHLAGKSARKSSYRGSHDGRAGERRRLVGRRNARVNWGRKKRMKPKGIRIFEPEESWSAGEILDGLDRFEIEVGNYDF